jgi:hypothetical protein
MVIGVTVGMVVGASVGAIVGITVAVAGSGGTVGTGVAMPMADETQPVNNTAAREKSTTAGDVPRRISENSFCFSA